jgi:hypothetical protein
VHAVSQHTPSTQSPDAQLVPVVHVVPYGSLHVPAAGAMLHFIGAAHDALVQHTASTHVSPVLQSGVTEQDEPGPFVEMHW